MKKNMILIEVRCIICELPMECIADIKIVGDGSMAHSLIKESLGGIYQCPKCGRKVDLQIRER